MVVVFICVTFALLQRFKIDGRVRDSEFTTIILDNDYGQPTKPDTYPVTASSPAPNLLITTFLLRDIPKTVGEESCPPEPNPLG